MISKAKRRLVKRLKRRRVREREGLALVEGPRVAAEALASSAGILWALVGEAYAGTDVGWKFLTQCRDHGLEPEFAHDDQVRRLCSTEAPQPVLMVVRPPPLESRSPNRGRYLVTDGVQNPGNFGTLVRSARGFGLDGVGVGRGTVDPWNDKVIRASAGAVFRMPLFRLPEGFARSSGPLPNLLYADPAGAPPNADEVGPDWVLVVGNEGSGVSRGFRRFGLGVAVPLEPGVDSLNVAVAGSILMYLLSRPRP